MKTRYSLYLLGVVTIFVSSTLVISCSDDDGEATPVISNVRLTDPVTTGVSLEAARLGQTIAVQGKNLENVVKLLLNDYSVPLNPNYITGTNILVTIADKVPFKPGVPNTLRLVTRNGQDISYPFKTFPPPAIVDAVSNEMANAGETITLYGRYFYFVNAVTFPGNVNGTNITTADDGTWLKVTVPAGVDAAGGHLSVTSNSGISSKTRRSHFGDPTGMFMNFDDLNYFAWGISGSNITTTTPNGIIKPIDDKFGLISMTVPKSWGWSNDKVIDIAAAKFYPTAEVAGPAYEAKAAIADFDLRLEAAVEEPTNTLDGLQLLVWLKIKDDEFSYAVPLSDGIKSLDGTWYTFSIPLSRLATSGGKKLETYGDLLSQNLSNDNVHEVRLVVNNTTDKDIKNTLTVDNLRIVNGTR